MKRVSQLLKSVRHSLTLRVAAVVLVSGPIILIAFMILSSVFLGGPDSPASIWLKLFRVVLAILVTTLLIGWLSSRLVTRPLKRFNQAIQSLQANKYKTRLADSGIAEFDKVFKNFNELTARLHQEEELRKNLISDTSHEFNTPLTAIMGQLTAMQEDKLPITKERIGTIQEQTNRLIELVEQLSAYTKARVPNPEVSVAFRLKPICVQTIDEMKPYLLTKHIKPQIRIANNLTVRTNPLAVQQILTNLLHNTIRYSEASLVYIGANSHGITYSDNGKGVPKDSLPHLFERFYRVESSRARSTGGLGLGLAIVDELVQQQGWTLRAELAQPGLTFIISFDN